MPRMILGIAVIALLTEMGSASQPTPKVVLTAPVPTQILNAKKVFVANSPGDNLPDSLGGPDRAYNEFYAAAKNWGQFEVVSTVSDADLVLAISFTSSLSGVGGTSSTGCSSSTAQYLRLSILDAKTGVSLWWFAQQVEQKTSFGHRPETFDAAFTRSVGTLVDNLKKLMAQPEAVKQH